MTAVLAPQAITEPGVYDMPDTAYHQDPVPGGSLSCTGAKRLLPPSCPALFKWERDHGRPERRAFDLGHAAHKMVLGAGPDLVSVEADDWRTKAAREQRDAAYIAGKVPLLATEVQTVNEMAAALREHPYASALFDPERGGRPEQSLFWPDERYDVWRRVRLDWLPDLTASGRLILADYKTCVSAEPEAVRKSVYNFGYFIQDIFYSDGVRALGLAEDVAFVFVFQEKTPPYLITVAECATDAKHAGRARVDLALEVFAECQATDTWPGYTSDVELVGLPRWAT